MDKATGSQPRGCGFETNYITNSFLLFFVLILLLKSITPETNGQNTPYTPGSCKSTRKNFGKPASSFSDFYM